MGESNQYLEIWNHTDKGYQPLVFSAGWQVALLNWEPLFDLEKLGEIERHKKTDEVFVLWKGNAALFVNTADGMWVEDMQPGVVYNVPKGVWHNLLSTRDASWIIVEDRNTHLHDTEIRTMSVNEMADLKANLPPWIEGE